jgi:hypothetical protein
MIEPSYARSHGSLYSESHGHRLGLASEIDLFKFPATLFRVPPIFKASILQ